MWEVPGGDISFETQRGRRTFAQAWEAWESEEEWEEGPIWSLPLCGEAVSQTFWRPSARAFVVGFAL